MRGPAATQAKKRPLRKRKWWGGGGNFGKRRHDERATMKNTFHSNWCHPLKIKVIQSSCISGELRTHKPAFISQIKILYFIRFEIIGDPRNLTGS